MTLRINTGSGSAPSSPRHRRTRSAGDERASKAGRGALSEPSTPSPRPLPSRQLSYFHTSEDGSIYRITFQVNPDLQGAIREAKEAIFDLLDSQGDLALLQEGEKITLAATAGGIDLSSSRGKRTIQTEEGKKLAQIFTQTPEPEQKKALEQFAAAYQKVESAAKKTITAPPPSSEKKKEEVRLQGLTNLGNTCYLNAGLQLWNTPHIRKELLAHPEAFKNGQKNHPLYRLLEKYETGKTILREDLEAVQTLTQLSLSQMHDAHEAFCILEDELDLSLLAQKGSPLVSNFRQLYTTNLKNPDAGPWEEHTRKRSSTDPTPTSIQSEFLGRKIIYPKKDRKLQELITEQRIDTTPVDFRIDGEDVQILRKIVPTKPPQTLLVQIQRNEYDSTTYVQKKKIDRIVVEPTLKIPRDLEGDRSSDLYQLTGFTVHLGSTKDPTNPRTGHWIAYRREGDQFIQFDDSIVSQRITEKEFLEAAGDAVQLVYQLSTN